MLNFAPHSDRALVCLTVVFASWLVGIATRPMSAACTDCKNHGCYAKQCVLWNSETYIILNASKGALCTAYFANTDGNNSYCTQSDATKFDSASGTPSCCQQVNIYGTIGADCTDTGVLAMSFQCCTSKCMAPPNP